jgi:hypothetical protein
MSNSAGDPIGKPTGEMRVPNPLDCRPVVMDRSNTHSSEEEKSKQKQTSHWLRRLRIFANVTLWLLSVLFTAVLIAWLTKSAHISYRGVAQGAFQKLWHGQYMTFYGPVLIAARYGDQPYWHQIMVSDLTISWKDYEQMKNGELKPIFVSPVINEAVRQINEDLGKRNLPVGESQQGHDDSALTHGSESQEVDQPEQKLHPQAVPNR